MFWRLQWGFRPEVPHPFSCFHVKCKLGSLRTRMDTFSLSLICSFAKSYIQISEHEGLMDTYTVQVCQGPQAVNIMTGESHLTPRLNNRSDTQKLTPSTASRNRYAILGQILDPRA